ncbi:hypothetical protein AQUCO_02700181v1 [Aquilegia coerulea]|uniref:Embryo-specific protein ATS3A n=1 Tax=Aquilegia coerulea TaxID=218851 RepID=A0A2G5D5K8_AQUCA|nr:hypothetical protein AQUCO_02700181v1 [Aquilegia coerulea]
MKKMRGMMFNNLIVVVFVALEISGLVRGNDQNLSVFPPKSEMKKKCNYTVRIETTCLKGAETSNHISIRFGDTKSNDILVRHLNTKHMRQVDPLQPADIDDVPKIPFQACTVDEFQVTGPCVESPICYLYLKSQGNDDWRPGVAQVRVSQAMHLSSNFFYFRRYLPRHVWHGSDLCDTEVSPFGIKHERKVFP